MEIKSLLALINTETGAIQLLGINGEHGRFSPENRFIVFQGPGDNERNIYMIDLNTRVTHRLTNHPKTDQEPIFSPSGSHVLFSSNRRSSWDLWALPATDGKASGASVILRQRT